MNRSVLYSILFLIIFGAASVSELYGQNYQNIRKELEAQQKKARSDIESLRDQITSFEEQVSEAADEYTRNYEEFRNLEREIALRNAVISSMEEERASILEELDVTQNEIDDLKADLETIIENYKSALTHLYKHGRLPDEVMLLSSSSLNQMLVRSYYLDRFETYRQNQARQIEEMQAELETRESELEDARRRNQQNIAETNREREVLEDRKASQEQKVAQLRRDRERLEQRLNATRSEAATLESTLTELIDEEQRIREAEQERLERLEQERRRRLASAENIRNRREREAQVARFSRPVESSELPSDSRLSDLETSFENLKGDLPWPVNSGVISAKFGNRINPVYGTRIDNPGIEIVTEPRSEVHAVHEGYVFAVQPIPGFGNCVFVKHGRYITVYGNMSDISVSRNSFVDKGEVIGRSGDENSLNGNSLFFMIREQNTNLDPEVWISSR
ncbi:murein hydrolase activator EnvC family protein [Natronogracilivirga saccharolytica]|uniref:Peptidoglycan DD-metalloendopeptidase family protein n=1 Tax=Natronogracilivirga saccharolytica TaxID=2812953 RepID=A0A8J7UVP0_9BACT|nr:peptidoglycan DD-metalloendopeptidase family protein [Natronogracilivirga saccharolytica]MBP3192751.1 peptidoglycan DD-metalloendopeptidase family protein [Natronogracilivirga saccharolytica]